MTWNYLLWALLATSVITCHYSCSTCVRPYYSACIICSNDGIFQTVEDPATTPVQFWPSVYKVGTCIATYSSGSNILGILLFVVLAAMCLFLRSKQSFYLMLAVQSIGLANLVEIAWVNPLGYVLESAQHLMIFNILGKVYKGNDFLLKVTGYHRIFNFLQQCSIGQNIAIIAVFSLIALILLIIIAIILRCRRNNQKTESKQNNREIIFQAMQNTSKELPPSQPQQEECSSWMTNDALIQIAKMLLAVLTLSVQQTMLVLLVAVVFIRPIVPGLIILCVFYLLVLGYILSYSYYIRMEYFQDRRILFLTFARKILLPVMIVIPIDKQYLFFVFALFLWLCEFIVDFRNGLYSKLSRLAFYKCAQILSLILLMIYYIVEVEAGSLSASRIAAVFGVVALACMFTCVVVELPFAIKQRFFTQELTKNQEEVRNETNEDIAAGDEKGGHVPVLEFSTLQRDDTLQDATIMVQGDNGKFNKEEEKGTQDDTSIIIQAQLHSNQIKIADPALEVVPADPVEPVRRKKRKHMIDKELRMRYGI